MPISGDDAGIECVDCSSTTTIYEEYGTSNSDESELGLMCPNCGHSETPEEFNHRFGEN
tara:strand:+ start:5033 stop:5209 length:177 start_codon:yes stop_codon:yes gene_type:complete